MGSEKQISDELLRRYPLLRQLVVRTAQDSPCEELPRFLGFLLAAAESDTPQICCVLLPETESIGYLTGTLLALSRLQQEFPELLREYATRGLEYGQKVRVLPNRYVYKYGGLWPGFPDFFNLQVLNATDKACRTFPVREILRLEPTERVLPKGKGATDLGRFQLSPLDRLIGIQTGGNTSLFRNHVFCLSARVEFDDLASTIRLSRMEDAQAETEGVPTDAIPRGEISSDGRIEREDRYQRSGEPLIAVTHSADYLAEACEAAAPFSKFVIVNEAEKLSRNLQAYDRIAASQRLLIVASHRSADAISPLAERGCHVWRLSPAELCLDERLDERCRSRGVIGGLFRAVDNWKRLDLVTVDCADERLETVAANLQMASDGISPEQADEESGRLLGRLFSLLCQASDACDAPSDDEFSDVSQRVELCRGTIAQRSVWLTPEVAAALRSACEGLASIYRDSPQELGRSKGAAVLDLVRKLLFRDDGRIALVARTSTRAAATAGWLASHGVTEPVMCIADRGEADEFDALVLTSWPNSRQFADLVGRYLAPRIYLVGYEFERVWFRTFRRYYVKRMGHDSLPVSEKAKLIDLPRTLLEDVREAQPAPEPRELEEMPDAFPVSKIEDIFLHRRKGASLQAGAREETRRAKYVGFVGATYTHLTEWQRVPVVTTLVRGTASSRQGIPLRRVEELNTGDYVVFREGGESNIIRLIAEEIVGREEYAKLRNAAELWRTALWRLADEPESGWADARGVLRILHRWGLTVGVQTVRNWLYDETHIGPGDESAIEAIAKAGEDQRLLTNKEEVWDAVRSIRSLHVDAGFRLTRLLLDEIRNNPPRVAARETRVDLGRGQAWIVEVEEIGDSFEERPASQVNRLLWDEGFA